MGEHSVSQFSDPAQKRQFTKKLLRDIQALEKMLSENMFETGIQRIGAEQELVLLNHDFSPATNNMEILDEINDEHYTTEIARFNLEINCDPFEFTGNCFQKLEKQLTTLLNKGSDVAEKKGTHILLTGITPTLGKEHLNFEYMTPNSRYKELNDAIVNQRGGNFELNMVGRDELITTHDNILFEACNTSFQVHLQLEPDEFVKQYNWSQMIAGPVLSAAVNSPIFMGKRLWQETRIGLFQQSVDTRTAGFEVRTLEPRVAFGSSWLKNSVTELYKDNISRFNLLFATDLGEDSMDILERGEIPKLKALNLHSGTVYKWNRACYGISEGKPHLRIENRYIPSGPTVLDEMANTAFWLGLMVGMPEKFEDLPNMMEFDEVRFNFYKAARNGLEAQFNWMGEIMPASRLIIKELIPIAKMGLEKKGVVKKDIIRLLRVIKARVSNGSSGASWQLRNFGSLLKNSTPGEASVQLVRGMYANQLTKEPVHMWEDIHHTHVELKEFRIVKNVMETDLYTVHEEDALDLVINVMDWQRIRHVPVENEKHELVGLINSHSIIRYLAEGKREADDKVKDIMNTDFHVTQPNVTTADAVLLMADNRTDALPVVNEEGLLLGIVTESDIIQMLKLTNLMAAKRG